MPSPCILNRRAARRASLRFYRTRSTNTPDTGVREVGLVRLVELVNSSDFLERWTSMTFKDERERPPERHKHPQRWSATLVVPEKHLGLLEGELGTDDVHHLRVLKEDEDHPVPAGGYVRLRWEYGPVRGANRADITKILARLGIRTGQYLSVLEVDQDAIFVPANGTVERICGCPKGVHWCRIPSEYDLNAHLAALRSEDQEAYEDLRSLHR